MIPINQNHMSKKKKKDKNWQIKGKKMMKNLNLNFLVKVELSTLPYPTSHLDSRATCHIGETTKRPEGTVTELMYFFLSYNQYTLLRFAPGSLYCTEKEMPEVWVATVTLIFSGT